LILTLFSCGKNNRGFTANAESARSSSQILAAQMPAAQLPAPLYHTWNSLNEMEYREPAMPLAEDFLIDGFFPWAGIVSHHILAHDYIDAWFSGLAKIRDIDCFFIISPDHYGLSLQPYSLTNGSWDSGFGLVESDREKISKLATSLDVDLDQNVFIFEHGISSLMPYLKKYFPNAVIVAIIISGESEVNTRTSGRLVSLLEKEFDNEGKSGNFLLISSDFSHNRGIEETLSNDFRSMQYLKNAEGSLWNMVICDNRSGIYILDRLGKNKMESVILYHTNSFEIAGGEPSSYGSGGVSGINQDITSYFFVYFSDTR